MDTSPSANFMQKFIKSAPKSDTTKSKAKAVGGSRLVKAMKGKKGK